MSIPNCFRKTSTIIFYIIKPESPQHKSFIVENTLPEDLIINKCD